MNVRVAHYEGVCRDCGHRVSIDVVPTDIEVEGNGERWIRCGECGHIGYYQQDSVDAAAGGIEA